MTDSEKIILLEKEIEFLKKSVDLLHILIKNMANTHYYPIPYVPVPYTYNDDLPMKVTF